jgi:hypothetical protein
MGVMAPGLRLLPGRFSDILASAPRGESAPFPVPAGTCADLRDGTHSVGSFRNGYAYQRRLTIARPNNDLAVARVEPCTRTFLPRRRLGPNFVSLQL